MIDSSPSLRPTSRTARRLIALLWVVVLAIVISFAFFASSLCITLLLAAFLAILADPIPTYFERWRVPRAVSSAVLILAGILLLSVAVYASYGKIASFMDDLPDYGDRIQDALRPLRQNIQKMQKTAGSLNPAAVPPAKRIPEVRVNQPASWPSYLIRGVGTVWGALIVGAIVPFLTFFVLVRKAHLYNWLSSAFGGTVDVPGFAERLCNMVRGFAIGNIVIGSAMSVVTVAVLLVLKLQGAVLLGIASGMLNLIPFLGVVLALAVPIMPAILQFQTPGPFLIIFLTVVGLHFLSANFLTPRFIGSRVNIGPVAATVGILFWGWLWGILGVLLAVPLTASVKLVADCHPGLIHISNLLADTPRPVPAWTRRTTAGFARALPFIRRHVQSDAKD
jgi:predicted PurR-regulated permease PerM